MKRILLIALLFSQTAFCMEKMPEAIHKIYIKDIIEQLTTKSEAFKEWRTATEKVYSDAAAEESGEICSGLELAEIASKLDNAESMDVLNKILEKDFYKDSSCKTLSIDNFAVDLTPIPSNENTNDVELFHVKLVHVANHAACALDSLKTEVKSCQSFLNFKHPQKGETPLIGTGFYLAEGMINYFNEEVLFQTLTVRIIQNLRNTIFLPRMSSDLSNRVKTDLEAKALYFCEYKNEKLLVVSSINVFLK